MNKNIVKLIESRNLDDIRVAFALLESMDLPYEEWQKYLRISRYQKAATAEFGYHIYRDNYIIVTDDGTIWETNEEMVVEYYPGMDWGTSNIKYKTWKEKILKERREKIKSTLRRLKENMKRSIGNGMRKLLEK